MKKILFSFCMGLAVVPSLTMYGMKEYADSRSDRLNQALVGNPGKVLGSMHGVEDEFVEALKKTDIGSDEKDISEVLVQYTKSVREFEEKSPVFMLGECVKEDWGACVLSREYEPSYRNAFEDNLVSLFLKKVNVDKKETIHYAGFASGGTFQDLVAVSKMLTHKPDAALTIHLIDTKYTPYAEYMNKVHAGREISLDHTVDPSIVRSSLVAHAREHWGAAEFTDEAIVKEISIECVKLELRFKQFFGHLKKKFPTATISLHVHDGAQQYLDYLDKNELAYPDITVTADIEDEMSIFHRALTDYISLCSKVLEKKPDAHNLWLAKSRGFSEYFKDPKIEAGLLRIHAGKAEEGALDVDDHPVHITFESVSKPSALWNVWRKLKGLVGY